MAAYQMLGWMVMGGSPVPFVVLVWWGAKQPTPARLPTFAAAFTALETASAAGPALLGWGVEELTYSVLSTVIFAAIVLIPLNAAAGRRDRRRRDNLPGRAGEVDSSRRRGW